MAMFSNLANCPLHRMPFYSVYMYIACHVAICTEVLWRLQTTTWHAIGPKRLMGKGSTGQGQHAEKNITVVWYIFYQRPLRPLVSLKFSILSFWWKITKPGHNFLEKEYFVTNSLFFFKRIKGFSFGGKLFPTFDLENMISIYTKDFSWKIYPKSLDFEENIISYCQIFMISPVGSRSPRI